MFSDWYYVHPFDYCFVGLADVLKLLFNAETNITAIISKSEKQCY